MVPTELPCPGQLNNGSQGSWGISVNITLVVTLEQKTSFGVVCGEKFQAPAVQSRNYVCHSNTDCFENGFWNVAVGC